MTNIELKNKFGAEKKYSEISTLKIPTTSGDFATFTRGEPATIINNLVCAQSETTVPNEGSVEIIHFNTTLAVEEVINLLSSLSYIQTPFLNFPIYPLLVSDDHQLAVFAVKVTENSETIYEIDVATDIANKTYKRIFCSTGTTSGFHMSNYAINKIVTNTFEGFSVGVENSQLVNLVSVSPFSYVEGENIKLAGNYTGIAIATDTNKLIDIKAALEVNKSIPLYIDVDLTVEPEGHQEITTLETVDVTNISTIQVVDENLKPENIKINTNILGITGKVLPELSEATLDTLSLQKLIEAKGNVENLFYKDSRSQFLFLESLDLRNFSSITKMFYGCSNLESISMLDTSNLTNTSYAFTNCAKLSTIPALNTSKVTDMHYMFGNCSSLIEIPLIDTSKAQDLGYMFYSCSNLQSVPQLNTSSATDMSYMFYNCSGLTSIPQLDTSKATTVSGMFYSCKNITQFPTINIPNATSASSLFESCSSMVNAPSILSTEKLTSTSSMFEGCSKLQSISLFDTSKVTNMSDMFYNCSKLATIPQLNMSSVTNVSRMFYNCESLTSVELLDLPKVTSMDYLFAGCSNLVDVKLNNSGLNGKNTGFTYVFSNCYKLELVDLSDYSSYYPIRDHSNNYGLSLFNNCYRLKYVIIRNFGEKYALCNSWNDKAENDTFKNCYLFKGTKHSTYNPSGTKSGKIYVPRNMVNTLVDTRSYSWGEYLFRALEDYTTDGTTTGEFNRTLAELPEIKINSYYFSVGAAGLGYYSLDDGQTWVDFATLTIDSYLPEIIGVEKIKFKITAGNGSYTSNCISSSSLGLTFWGDPSADRESDTITLTSDLTDLRVSLTAQ